MRSSLVYFGLSAAVLLSLLATPVHVSADINPLKVDVEVKRAGESSPYNLHETNHKQSGKVIFEDNFDSDKLDDKYWSYELGDGCKYGICGWGNDEKQVYDDKSVKTGVKLGLGKLFSRKRYLQITARRVTSSEKPVVTKPRQTGSSWTSGKILTRDKFTFRYGRVDVRARLPVVDGAFPAIWMLPQDNAYGIWPNSGEIDITEYQSIWRKKHQPEQMRTPGSLHFAKYHGATAKSFWAEGNDPSEWHVYSMIWREDGVKFLLDGKEYGSYTPPTTQDPTEWPFNKPFYLIMNLAIEPGFGTKVPADVNKITMEVDWIRVTKE
ncbi:concanavalin A-like lectin/glucanase domain-containing protein [Syncephalis pseudoplumigaleata]|uniref:Concanavalin A-like lectin/glucanase domain-containing protein n=1 Tax=Syncephalis pseudoplumigaleata TaxID=1712513 RepID=A0A4P9YY88_9FUNG|nr:concanavalin A-like lectin/glucanase domain-containing protein [Syncephalis pseudoplumigaleata]|eukprot:RKP25004.1 concanavalin A-like lectin/glucanase domain-containing protein [Syncephalis pseudoplumigaleata]